MFDSCRKRRSRVRIYRVPRQNRLTEDELTFSFGLITTNFKIYLRTHKTNFKIKNDEAKQLKYIHYLDEFKWFDYFVVILKMTAIILNAIFNWYIEQTKTK